MSIKKEIKTHEKLKDLTTNQSNSKSNINNENFTTKFISFLIKNASYKYNSKIKYGNLYELLTSDYISIEHLFNYLINKEDIFIIDFIINLLYKKFKNIIYYYLTQLCSLTLSLI